MSTLNGIHCDGKPIELRDYQSGSIEILRQLIRSGKKNVVLCIATGGGKTVCAAYLLKECYDKGKHAVFVVDRISLINQTSETLDRYGIPHGIIQASHWRTNNEPIQVASIQTMVKRGWPKAHLIVVDECHTISKCTVKKIEPREVVTIGLSATPFTPGLGKIYDAVVNTTTLNILTGEGFLVPFRVFAASEPDMNGCKVTAGEWSDKDCSDRAMPIVGDAVAEYLKHGKDRKFIGFGCDVNHCEELRRQFLGAGVNVELYTYKTPDEERAEIVREFKKLDSSIRGIISVSAISKGFDVTDVGVIIMCRPLKSSLTEHIQILGRGLRPHSGKQECLVLDHSGNCMRFWNEMQDFFERGINELDDGKKRLRKKPEKKKPAAKKCPHCHHIHKPAPSCPECGHVYPPAPAVKHTEGELKEFSSTSATKADKQSWYSQLLGICADRGYAAGWVSHKYKEKFGVWPKGLVEIAADPSDEVKNWIRSRNIAFHKALKKSA